MRPSSSHPPHERPTRPPRTPRSNWPGYRTLFNEYAIFFPFGVRGISPGPAWQTYTRHAQFARRGWDVITGVRLPLPSFR